MLDHLGSATLFCLSLSQFLSLLFLPHTIFYFFLNILSFHSTFNPPTTLTLALPHLILLPLPSSSLTFAQSCQRSLSSFIEGGEREVTVGQERKKSKGLLKEVQRFRRNIVWSDKNSCSIKRRPFSIKLGGNIFQFCSPHDFLFWLIGNLRLNLFQPL